MNKSKCILTLALLICISSCTSSSSLTSNPIDNTMQPPQVLTAEPASLSNYIGRVYPPLPSSLKLGPGMLISPPSGSQSWGVDILTDGYDFMLWLDWVVYHDKDGVPHMKVSDNIVLPPPQKNYVIIVSACSINNSIDPEVVVLAKIDEEYFNDRYVPNANIHLAWRANQKTGKLEEIETHSIECYADTVLEYPWKTP